MSRFYPKDPTKRALFEIVEALWDAWEEDKWPGYTSAIQEVFRDYSRAYPHDTVWNHMGWPR